MPTLISHSKSSNADGANQGTQQNGSHGHQASTGCSTGESGEDEGGDVNGESGAENNEPTMTPAECCVTIVHNGARAEFNVPVTCPICALLNSYVRINPKRFQGVNLYYNGTVLPLNAAIGEFVGAGQVLELRAEVSTDGSGVTAV